MSRYHVGLNTYMLANWGGGRDLLRILAAGLAEAGVRVTVLVPVPTRKDRLLSAAAALRSKLHSLGRRNGRPLPGRPEKFPPIEDYLAESGCNFEVARFPSDRAGLARTMRERAIDVVLPCMKSLGRGFPHPWIAYIADLQHKHLPQLFSLRERAHRDRAFSALLRSAPALVVNSRDTRQDLETCYGTGGCSVFSLPFSPMLQPGWVDADIGQAQAKYGLRAPYFMVASQLWSHKDHLTAIKALAILERKNIQLVCTGNTHDARTPAYYGEILAAIEKLGLAERVRFLGYVSKLDQIALMRGAVAVAQPTLFEGGPGGGAVYDAVALGVPAIVSDIPVNREIDEGSVVFFRAGSAEELASRMTAVLDAQPARMSGAALMEQSSQRRKRLGSALLELVAAAIASHEAERKIAARLAKKALRGN